MLLESQLEIHFISLCGRKGDAEAGSGGDMFAHTVVDMGSGEGGKLGGTWGAVRFSFLNGNWTQCLGNLRLSLVYSELVALIPSFPMSFPF